MAKQKGAAATIAAAELETGLTPSEPPSALDQLYTVVHRLLGIEEQRLELEQLKLEKIR